jgi:hypothetical protein
MHTHAYNHISTYIQTHIQTHTHTQVVYGDIRIRALKKRKLATKDRIQTLQKSISDLKRDFETAALADRLDEGSGQTSTNGNERGVIDMLLEKLDVYGLKLEAVPPHRYVCVCVCMYVCMVGILVQKCFKYACVCMFVCMYITRGVIDMLLEQLDVYGLKLEGVTPHMYVCVCTYVVLYVCISLMCMG